MSLRLFRTLLVMALALTVPVQGVAAIGAGVCMALGQHDGGALESHVHEHAGADGHDHSGVDHSALSDSHCPPCASCCAATALASVSLLGIPERATLPAVPVLLSPFSGVTPESLDRPPLAL